jgi:predicted ATPase
MWISNIKLENIRGFIDTDTIELSKNINLFVGQNNSGKSTLLNSILLLQYASLDQGDITLGRDKGRITHFVQNTGKYLNKLEVERLIRELVRGEGGGNWTGTGQMGGTSFTQLEQTEPNNPIYPYLSKRKVSGFSEDVGLQSSIAVTGNLQHLNAKIDRLSNPYFQPAHDEYVSACKKILGFVVSAVNSGGGKKAAYIVKNLEHIPLIAMGEGVSNVLGLITDLCIAEKKIFLLEEPENDIHPKALKTLLELIANKSGNNQFFISTHSNIVTKYLGSIEDSKVFRVSMSLDEVSRLPISNVEEVENEPNARLKLLEELGYEPFDFGQWKAWLFLEESSAESIIKDFLIPKFVPKLKNKLRTYSAGSRDEVERKFRDFNNLFVFIHLEPLYRNKAWILIDSGEDEEKVISKMKEYYLKHNWNENNFLQLTKHNFEEYYPERFQEEIKEILSLDNKDLKRQRKKNLTETVNLWIAENPEEAKQKFEESAKDVITILKQIAKQID